MVSEQLSAGEMVTGLWGLSLAFQTLFAQGGSLSSTNMEPSVRGELV